MSELVASMEGSNMSSNIDSFQANPYGNVPIELDVETITVRRTDADDCALLESSMDPTTQEQIDLLYNYPKLIQRLETCFLSVTIIDSEFRVVGMAIFDDYPQGLEGAFDYVHENAWEQWLHEAYAINDDFSVRPFNSLWLTYFYLDKRHFKISSGDESELLKAVLLNVYGTFPNVEGINYMIKGDVYDEMDQTPAIASNVLELFVECKQRNPDILKKVRGIHKDSRLFYSPRENVFDFVEIRVAKQEDHDDLAEIFNQQSEILTTQYGDYFIAELIAYQNEDQKALVAQVQDKAVGLMSISKDIDYKLLAECFDLDQYDNLLKPEFMEAVRDHREDMLKRAEYEQIDIKREIETRILQNKMKCSHLGQRIKLQQYMQDKVVDVADDIDYYMSNEEQYKTLTREMFESKIDTWLKDFTLDQPEEIFEEYKVLDPEVSCWIISERDFFLKTLTFFGLPSNYIAGEGHWHDWAFKQLEEKKQMALKGRLGVRKKKDTKRRAKHQDKQEEEIKPPSYFDLAPFKKAFDRFIAAGPEVRTAVRSAIMSNLKQFMLIFSDKDAVLREAKDIDIMKLGKLLKEKQIGVSEGHWELIPLMMDCFGDLNYDEKITKEMPGEKKREVPLIKKGPVPVTKMESQLDKKVTNLDIKDPKMDKKDTKLPESMVADKEEEEKKEKEEKEKEEKEKAAQPADPVMEKLSKMVNPIDIIERFSSYQHVMNALNKIARFDQMMCRLGIIDGNKLKEGILRKEVEEIVDNENKEEQDEVERRKIVREHNDYRQLAETIHDQENLPEIPDECHNAIVINLFCIDEKFESRSLDFLEKAFQLFPDRDYIIVTQPHIVGENMLLQVFSQMPKKKRAIFDDVLYIFHRDALLAPLITVKRSSIEDISDARFLFQQSNNAKEIEADALESIKSLTSNKTSFTATCEGTIIGFYVMTKDVNLMHYKSHFSIQDYMLLNQHPRSGFSKIIHSVLNPVFIKYSRYVLKELMRLANKTTLFFETHPTTALPDIFSEMILTRNRKFPHLLERKWDYERDPEYMEKFQDLKYVQDGNRDYMDEKEAPFSLSMITKKLLSVNKINNNTRIVVVGASDTGISFIESLLSVRYVNFPHIVLLAPGGLRNNHVKSEYMQLKQYSTNYTLKDMKNLLLDSRITVLDARMVDINRKEKTIKLDRDGATLPYDVLVMTLGLIDVALQEFELVSEGIGELNEKYGCYEDKKYIKGVFSIDDPYLYDKFSPNKGKNSVIGQLTRPKKPENIIVYGRSLNVYCFINGLINRGVKPERIMLVLPPKSFEKKDNFQTNQEKYDYEDMLVWDPPAFDDEDVEKKVLETLQKLGVTVKTDLELKLIIPDQTTNELSGIKFKIHGELEDPQKDEKEETIPAEDEDPIDRELLDEDGEEEEQEDAVPRDEIEIQAKFLVTSGGNDIDLGFFHAIHNNGLVYNGRLIVKNNFQTTDPAIFAAGRVCEFSQRYKNQAIGISLRLDKYSGREVGQKLAKAILEHIGLVGADPTEGDEEELPVFFMPLGTGGVLPNDLFYYHIRKIEWARPSLTIGSKKNREDLHCDNVKKLLHGHFIKFNYDNNGLIEDVTYMGSEKISIQSLISFVGLSERYLNKLDVRYKSGLIENVTEFLSENWAIALYHEWFSLFRQKTKMDVAAKPNIQELFQKVAKTARKGKYLTKDKYEKLRASVSQEVIKAIEDGTLDFIRENLNHLPMYYIPDEEFK